MTDRTERDLTAALEAWATATDPGTDPVTPDDVRSRPRHGGEARPARHRRWVVAAVALVVLGLAAAMAAIVTGPDDGQVTTGPADEDGGPGTRTQVVIEAPDIDPSWWNVAYRVVLRDPDGRDDVLAGPLVPGTSLVVDRPLAPGRWTLLVQRFDCTTGASGAESCGAPGLDGTPTAAVERVQCALPLDVGATESRVLVGYGTTADGGLACGFPTDRGVELTVPPAWTLRDELPWSCGAASFDVNGMARSSDPQAALATLRCIEDAVATGTPVEVPVAEPQPGDGLTRSWWRVLPEPVDGHRIEAIRDQGLEGTAGWARVRCDGIDIEHGNIDTTTPDGGITGYDHGGARLTGCGAEEPLPLDVPLLDPPPPPPSTTTTTRPGSRPVDVVLDGTDLPFGAEPARWRWTLHLGDEDTSVATGTVLGADADADRPVAMIADDLAVPSGTDWVGVRIDGPGDRGGVGNLCLAGPPPPDQPDARVLVVRLAASDCTAEWVDAVPSLTVPPGWSLRTPPDAECVVPDGGTAEDAGHCLARAQADDRTAEWWTTDDEGRPLVWRVNGLRDVDLVHPGVDGADWTVEQCLGVALLDLVPGPEVDGCAPPEAMPLTP